MKPHHGKIECWRKYIYTDKPDKGLGYIIYGTFIDHHIFGGRVAHTSYVVSHDPETGEIETRNSRYTLVGKEITNASDNS